MSEKYKFVKVKEREYRIGKFNAMHGTYVLAKISSVVVPAMKSLFNALNLEQVKAPEDILKDTQTLKSLINNIDVTALFAPLSSMSETDFMYVQKKCLGVCHVNLPSGFVPAMHENGTFSIPDLEDDTFAVMALIVHALMHNYADFLSGNRLMGSPSTILPSNSQN